jgi:hypothetical protein
MMHWDVPIQLNAQERKAAKRLHCLGTLSGFLREIRHELFDARFDAELAKAYKKPRGTAPLPPALLAMGILLQAYEQVGNADAVVTASMDKRWQLVLGRLAQKRRRFRKAPWWRFVSD